MRVDGTLYYVLKDHLGSASVVTENDGDVAGEQRYYPFGETRFSTGTMYTDKLFTGQREMAELGIYHYGARFYSPTLGRFLSADTIVPGYANPQNLNRFAYVLNNPLKYTDPTGHWVVETDDPVQEQRRNANRHREERERNRRERNRAYALYHVQSDTNLYMLGWQNFGAAWSIYTNSNATISQRVGAGLYMGAWGGAHAGLVVGGTILAAEAVVPGSMSCVMNPACQDTVTRTSQEIVDDIAMQVARNTGGVLSTARGSGWRVTLQGATATGNDIVARIMTSGGQRLEPYYRVAVQNVGALTSNGQISTDPALTHHVINLANPIQTVNAITNLINGLFP
jgi:RHS repeat-associated protein